jgi:hypothetical protein
MLSAIVFHIDWKTGVEPVKCTPARCSLCRAAFPIVAPSP